VLGFNSNTGRSDATLLTVDLKGFQSVIVVGWVAGGARFSGNKTLTLEALHSDDNVTFEAVPSNYLLGAEPGVKRGEFVVFRMNVDAPGKPFRFGYSGDSRYLRIAADVGGNLDGNVTINTMVIASHPLLQPTAAQR